MEGEELDEYEETLLWALEEEKTRLTRVEGIGTFYLVIASILVFIIFFFILYFSNRGKKQSIIDSMNDPDNVLEGSQEEDEDIPLIEISEEEEGKNIDAPLGENMVEEKPIVVS